MAGPALAKLLFRQCAYRMSTAGAPAFLKAIPACIFMLQQRYGAVASQDGPNVLPDAAMHLDVPGKQASFIACVLRTVLSFYYPPH